MIQPGTTLGVYEILAPLGAGGMGDVYRARDTRLGREVALKVLPPRLAADAATLARFEQEARLVAALNHPNIVALFDIGAQDGVAFTVSELVDGETLRGARPPARKVAEIGAQLADALAAAHGAGVTHRDVKPGNVVLTREGRVKLLDFGIARTDAPPEVDGVTLAQTRIGTVAGTVGYMAPEQVRAESVDHRADVFAAGALLHELLAGAPPFAGDTAAEVIAATLKDDPPELPPAVPDGLRRIVRRCLEKQPEERFQSARDLAFALRQLAGSAATTAETGTGAPRAPRVSRAVAMAAAGCAIGMLLTSATALRWSASRDAEIDPVRLTRITADRVNAVSPAFSPDGRSLAFRRPRGGLSEIVVTSFDSATPVTLVRSETNLGDPVWSADGNQVCYTSVARSFHCVGAAGGVPRTMLAEVTAPQIGADGSLFFIRAIDGLPWLLRQPAGGGEPERVGDRPLPADVSRLSPVSPDGSALVALTGFARWLVSVPDGVRRELPSEAGVRTVAAAWLPDGRHLVVAEQLPIVIGYRLVLQDTRSTARRVIVHSADPIGWVAVDPNGARIVYAGGPVERDLVEFSAEGRFVRTAAASSMLERFPSWAPAGDRFVYRAGGPGRSDGLWLGRDDSGTATFVQPLTSNAEASQTPVSPDGQRIAYVDAGAIYVIAVSGGRPVRLLTSSDLGAGAGAPIERLAGLCWSPDGDWIWYSEGPGRLGRVPSAGGEPVIVEAPAGVLADCSPDGRWLVRRGTQGFVLTSTDGRDERLVAGYEEYASRAATSVQFGARGAVLYVLRLDRRTIDVLEVEGLRRQRSIAFELSPEDQIEGFAFSPDGTRAILTIGGDRNELWMAEGYARPASSWTRWFGHWAPPAPPAR